MLSQRQNKSNGSRPAALIIDRDADVHRFIHIILGKEFDVHHAYFEKLAVSLLERQRFSLVFASLEMTQNPKIKALQQKIDGMSGQTPIIGLAPDSDRRRRKGATSMSDCIGKPLDERSVRATMENALSSRLADVA